MQIAKTYYTNRRLYAMLRPDAMDNPYVYDNFQWAHCDVSFYFFGTYPYQNNSPDLNPTRSDLVHSRGWC